MSEKLSVLLLYSSPFAVLPALVLAWYKYGIAGPAFRILAYHLSFVAFTSILSALLWFMNENNLPLLHVYTIVEFTFISLYFSYVLKGSVPKAVWAGLFAFAAFAVWYAACWQGWNLFNPLPRSVESLLVIILCIAYYARTLAELKVDNLFREAAFWLNTGWLFYFSAALFLFTMSNYILPLNRTLNVWVWTLHAFFSDILYLFIFIGLWQIRRT